MERDTIAVLDFGSQYAHLIAKRIRHLGFYAEIFSTQARLEELEGVKGIILSGGPASVFGADAPPFNAEIFSLRVPILGLCYGHQLMAQHFGGEIRNTGQGEFGKAFLELSASSPLWEGIEASTQVWMSHGDSVTRCPTGFEAVARTSHCAIAAMRHQSLPLFSFQFHPEVKDSLQGVKMLENFVKLCQARPSWSMERYVDEAIASIRALVGERKVLMFLSGGVDSSVAFALLNQALGQERVLGLFIDNGFARKNEPQEIMERYTRLGFQNVRAFDASPFFLEALAGQVDPQEKRHRVGAIFVQVRNRFLDSLQLDPKEWMLGQGTLYPDIIESGGTQHSNVIKSHHNRVHEVRELIEAGQVIEPLKDLYKDEVRRLGEVLGLPEELVWRHPFPGPGLSINVLCSHGSEAFLARPEVEQAMHHCAAADGYRASLLPVRSVGVQGDQRTYTQPAVLIGPKDWETLERTAIRLTNEVRAINRVVTLLAPEELPALKLGAGYCTKERLDLLREADFLATQAIREAGLMREIFQLLVILLPLSVEGQGQSIVLRPVVSEDVMTAQFAKLPWPLVQELAAKILAIPGVDAVFYDVTHKPPATFGWE